MTKSYLSLGSNLFSPLRQLRTAVKELNKLPRTYITKISSLYFSKPWGVHAQPPFYNMVIEINTTLHPKALLKYCQSIELNHNRTRKKHWGPRTLDIDILLYGNIILNKNDLIIPHKEMLNRDFVLAPILEISPNLQLPNGDYLSLYLKNCEKHIQ